MTVLLHREVCAGWGLPCGKKQEGHRVGHCWAHKAPAGLVCAADRRESVGHRVGKGIGHDQQGQVAGVWNAPSEALSLHPQSSGSYSEISFKRET